MTARTPQADPAEGARPSGAQHRILVLAGDSAVAQVITGSLQQADFLPVVVMDAATGLELARRLMPDLVVLDLRRRGGDGIRFCRELRIRSRVPVIMLTSWEQEEDRLRGFAAGVDDYLTTPFSPRDLVLRVRAVLRRTTVPSSSTALSAGDLVVDPPARTVTKSGRELSLRNMEFELLLFLLANPGRVVRREELMREVWGQDFGDASTVTVHVRRLREKIEDEPSRPELLVTVWGVGYRFDLPGDPAGPR
ncbi:response regulator transcription factor [Saccharopolyspora sp. NFXS83]|uniref:response regulator transcription factor n=1 Tax=Saccharopolyspora sp. NFXS83 TaxID=2993560 RepID=UPI00224B4443|nr:response regulator transcription factor [Saccharopolyspora sp. NFXS83]MCX2731738.1 response regulator transcription factor [Saccharopolyspora sp. NFXS83]